MHDVLLKAQNAQAVQGMIRHKLLKTDDAVGAQYESNCRCVFKAQTKFPQKRAMCRFALHSHTNTETYTNMSTRTHTHTCTHTQTHIHTLQPICVHAHTQSYTWMDKRTGIWMMAWWHEVARRQEHQKLKVPESLQHASGVKCTPSVSCKSEKISGEGASEALWPLCAAYTHVLWYQTRGNSVKMR